MCAGIRTVAFIADGGNIREHACRSLGNGDLLGLTVIGHVGGRGQLDGHGIVGHGASADGAGAGRSDGVTFCGVLPIMGMNNDVNRSLTLVSGTQCIVFVEQGHSNQRRNFTNSIFAIQDSCGGVVGTQYQLYFKAAEAFVAKTNAGNIQRVLTIFLIQHIFDGRAGDGDSLGEHTVHSFQCAGKVAAGGEGGFVADVGHVAPRAGDGHAVGKGHGGLGRLRCTIVNHLVKCSNRHRLVSDLYWRNGERQLRRHIAVGQAGGVLPGIDAATRAAIADGRQIGEYVSRSLLNRRRLGLSVKGQALGRDQLDGHGFIGHGAFAFAGAARLKDMIRFQAVAPGMLMPSGNVSNPPWSNVRYFGSGSTLEVVFLGQTQVAPLHLHVDAVSAGLDLPAAAVGRF